VPLPMTMRSGAVHRRTTQTSNRKFKTPHGATMSSGS
jgi:hypothetical protein